MTVWTAVVIITWIAIVLLFLALGAVVRQVRTLQAQIARHATEFAATKVSLYVRGDGRTRILLAADSGCPLCVEAARLLAAMADSLPVPAALLTYEDGAAWTDRGLGGLAVQTDPESWQAVAHMSPPLLILAGPDGEVRRLVLPADAAQAGQTLRDWSHSIPMPSPRSDDAVHA